MTRYKESGSKMATKNQAEQIVEIACVGLVTGHVHPAFVKRRFAPCHNVHVHVCTETKWMITIVLHATASRHQKRHGKKRSVNDFAENAVRATSWTVERNPSVTALMATMTSSTNSAWYKLAEPHTPIPAFRQLDSLCGMVLNTLSPMGL